MIKIIEKIKLYRKAFITNYMRIHYSQFGEDVILKELIRKKSNGIYVDVGCYHPKKFSNTYMLHKMGWKGINIDMEANKIYLFQISRPNDYNVISAVSDENKDVEIYRKKDFSLESTIEKKLSSSSSLESIKIKTKTLDDIVKSCHFQIDEIDVLSIDCEGHDFNVLKSIDIERYNTKIIIIEDHNKDIESIIRGDMYLYIVNKGYILKSWCLMSLIFVKKDCEFEF